jgi:hypothetical protein
VRETNWIFFFHVEIILRQKCNCRHADISFNCRRADIEHSNAAVNFAARACIVRTLRQIRSDKDDLRPYSFRIFGMLLIVGEGFDGVFAAGQPSGVAGADNGAGEGDAGGTQDPGRGNKDGERGESGEKRGAH